MQNIDHSFTDLPKKYFVTQWCTGGGRGNRLQRDTFTVTHKIIQLQYCL